MLHPDTETDPVEKSRKEELMKQVTSAYDEKDLATLLKLEMEWVSSENDHLETLSDSKLATYITVLKEQLAEIKHEEMIMYSHPRFMDINHIIHCPEKIALNRIRITESDYKQKIASALKTENKLSSANSKKEIIGYLNKIQEEMEFEEDMFNMQQIFGSLR